MAASCSIRVEFGNPPAPLIRFLLSDSGGCRMDVSTATDVAMIPPLMA
jgi:hypothetical protein